jgi:hypothetical protein
MNINKTSVALGWLACCLAGAVYADSSCKSLQLTTPGTISPTDCMASGILSDFNASKQYPDVFANSNYQFPFGVTICYVSNGDLSATLDGEPVLLATQSMWTTDFKPALLGFPGYSDGMGSVITQVSVYNAAHKLQGKVFLRDAIVFNLPASSSELNTVVGGSGRYANVKGALRIDSHDIASTDTVPLSSVTGTLCMGGRN